MRPRILIYPLERNFVRPSHGGILMTSANEQLQVLASFLGVDIPKDDVVYPCKQRQGVLVENLSGMLPPTSHGE